MAALVREGSRELLVGKIYRLADGDRGGHKGGTEKAGNFSSGCDHVTLKG